MSTTHRDGEVGGGHWAGLEIDLLGAKSGGGLVVHLVAGVGKVAGYLQVLLRKPEIVAQGQDSGEEAGQVAHAGDEGV